jgi:hypothetical protein
MQTLRVAATQSKRCACLSGSPAAWGKGQSFRDIKDPSHVYRGGGGDAREGDIYNPWRFKKSCKGVPLARLMVQPRHSMHSTGPRGCLSKYIQPTFARVIACLQQLQTGGSAWYRISPFGASVYAISPLALSGMESPSVDFRTGADCTPWFMCAQALRLSRGLGGAIDCRRMDPRKKVCSRGAFLLSLDMCLLPVV